ncbi:flotillin-like FloA family protein [Bacteroides sp. 214]|uniref:flotillin-like FloA family protein n=1 Tax=Bacteroides sp. 214 TaxID=2302935 RepID=UPI0013D8B9D2|nr:flotillin-like FloA family protein [Bacteroides sp. 214]
METFILIGIFVVFIVLLINLPVFVIMLIAKTNKVKLSYREALKLYRCKVADKSFLKSVAKFQEKNIPVSVAMLVAHKLSGGNLENCVEGLIYAKENNLETDFLSVSAFDLAGKNVKESFLDANQVYEIKLRDLTNGKISIDYFVNYKYEFPSVFVEKDCEKVKDKIEGKLGTFLESWNNTNTFETEEMIRKNILNTDFWEGNLRIVLISQKIIIREEVEK